MSATALLSVASFSNAALFKNLPTDQDAELSVGVNVMAVKSAYDLEDSTDVRVLPGIFYDNNRVYARGAQAGAYLLNDGVNQLAAYAQLAGSEFDPDDANGALQGLEKRKSSAEAGISYLRRTPIGGIRGQFATDVLDESALTRNLVKNPKVKLYLKREDLLHGGAHKTNQVLGQALLTKRMGKKEVIAETGAGQHGVATALACALLGLKCRIYMGAKDVERQQPNVFRMKLMGAEVIPVTAGSGTLKDAVNEALRDWFRG